MSGFNIPDDCGECPECGELTLGGGTCIDCLFKRDGRGRFVSREKAAKDAAEFRRRISGRDEPNSKDDTK